MSHKIIVLLLILTDYWEMHPGHHRFPNALPVDWTVKVNVQAVSKTLLLKIQRKGDQRGVDRINFFVIRIYFGAGGS